MRILYIELGIYVMFNSVDESPGKVYYISIMHKGHRITTSKYGKVLHTETNPHWTCALSVNFCWVRTCVRTAYIVLFISTMSKTAKKLEKITIFPKVSMYGMHNGTTPYLKLLHWHGEPHVSAFGNWSIDMGSPMSVCRRITKIVPLTWGAPCQCDRNAIRRRHDSPELARNTYIHLVVGLRATYYIHLVVSLRFKA